MQEQPLAGKIILVTGASSGIGAQVAIECDRAGASVVITGRDAKRLNETFAQLTNSPVQYVADLTDESEMKKFISSLTKINGFVHCAGILQPFPIKFITQAKIRETFSANFDMAVLLVAQLAAQKKMEKKSSLVFISSVGAQHPHKCNSLYNAAKAALENFSKTVAMEFQPIRSNCICPAMIKTPMFDQTVHGLGSQRMEDHIATYPLGVGYPKDVADTAIFLLSEKSRWITGTNITLDGGFIIGK